jgi:hypothetical protein
VTRTPVLRSVLKAWRYFLTSKIATAAAAMAGAEGLVVWTSTRRHRRSSPERPVLGRSASGSTGSDRHDRAWMTTIAVPRKVSSMTADPVSSRASLPAGYDRAHTRLARWAVGMAAAVAVTILVSAAIFAMAYAIGGPGATEDNWVGLLGVVSLLGGLVASLAAFTLALAAKIKDEQWALLWLPLFLFPALLAFLVLGELFWWE